ncbi:glycosyltransferase [Cellulomonas telluris]|uniref:glycosyltransferase n=1 Tax=Cellulomonas telluris TaxID=2306636 RepID=UPI0010A79C69|nr:glycosyltransferase [Cellulomonas telluris]
MPDRVAGGDAGATTQVVAVVTAFQPDDGLLEVVRSVGPQVDRVVVVDDGSSDEAAPVLARAAEAGATVLRQGANLGIGAALNAGLRAAGDADVLTLDQDSRVPAGYVAALRAALDAARAAGVAVGMVGPGRATGVRAAAAAPGAASDVVEGREPIQSGLLLPADALAALGPFDAALFIDGVDTEYWLRARAAGFRAVVAPGTQLEHRLGRAHEVRLAGRRLAVTHAAIFRYYYIARNRVVLVRRYGRREPVWALGAVVRDVRHLAITCVLVPGRLARLRETAAGLRDGARGRTGRRPPRR